MIDRSKWRVENRGDHWVGIRAQGIPVEIYANSFEELEHNIGWFESLGDVALTGRT